MGTKLSSSKHILDGAFPVDILLVIEFRSWSW